mmetsp:Transcript_1590/g.4807  ORF Transcript_1590/g.4807 Transcript_1590/m.4807 type:complete len:200 (+) Transcript_1590:2060-2659(+)
MEGSECRTSLNPHSKIHLSHSNSPCLPRQLVLQSSDDTLEMFQRKRQAWQGLPPQQRADLLAGQRAGDSVRFCQCASDRSTPLPGLLLSRHRSQRWVGLRVCMFLCERVRRIPRLQRHLDFGGIFSIRCRAQSLLEQLHMQLADRQLDEACQLLGRGATLQPEHLDPVKQGSDHRADLAMLQVVTSSRSVSPGRASPLR